ncbi:hypothetical protein J6590_056667 [Homalodisca vitripennis]|nr:hypothetical protein J6590_056667 [Homalodisca vitripennis]
MMTSLGFILRSIPPDIVRVTCYLCSWFCAVTSLGSFSQYPTYIVRGLLFVLLVLHTPPTNTHILGSFSAVSHLT